MAFKMKGSPMARNYGIDPAKKGYKSGDAMTESNSSEEMRRLYNTDTGVEYETDSKNAEWQRRRDLGAARLAYATSLGAPTGQEVLDAGGVNKKK